ncbi:MAG: MBL fold metallo-hydrolase, partial [Candidatus Eisenbacteria bacterium]
MRARDPSSIGGVSVPAGQPIVAVCAQGKSSILAVRAMREHGIDAMSLKGGMQAWSLAWNVADVELTGSKAIVIQVRRTGKGCLSYIMGSDGEAAVVDASVDPEIYLRIAEERGLRILYVLDTHVHADHLSRSRALAARCSAEVLLPDQDRVTYPFRALREGDSIDTLFPGAVGRPDLAASSEQARKRAHLLHATLQRIAQLAPETWILPCHTSEPIPFDGRPCGARLSDVIRQVDMMRASEDTFVEMLLSRIPQTPPNHLEIVRLNERGEFPGVDPT